MVQSQTAMNLPVTKRYLDAYGRGRMITLSGQKPPDPPPDAWPVCYWPRLSRFPWPSSESVCLAVRQPSTRFDAPPSLAKLGRLPAALQTGPAGAAFPATAPAVHRQCSGSAAVQREGIFFRPVTCPFAARSQDTSFNINRRDTIWLVRVRGVCVHVRVGGRAANRCSGCSGCIRSVACRYPTSAGAALGVRRVRARFEAPLLVCRDSAMLGILLGLARLAARLARSESAL